MFAFFSMLIANCNDSMLKELNSNAKLMIKLADVFQMYSQRDTFISMFVQFSGFDLVERREMKLKNVHFLLSLLELGIQYPENLHTGWTVILRIALKLENIYTLKSKVKSPRNPKEMTDFERNLEMIFETSNLNIMGTASDIYPRCSSLSEASLLNYFESLCAIA